VCGARQGLDEVHGGFNIWYMGRCDEVDMIYVMMIPTWPPSPLLAVSKAESPMIVPLPPSSPCTRSQLPRFRPCVCASFVRPLLTHSHTTSPYMHACIHAESYKHNFLLFRRHSYTAFTVKQTLLKAGSNTHPPRQCTGSAVNSTLLHG
jgi:hypothetical protein